MPASDSQEGRRGGRLLTVVFWAGVGLAPLAALLVLVGSGAGALRVAAVLAILAVVLIGLSVMLRPDAAAVRLEMEEALVEEIDLLREDVRADITTAARATHKSFSEKLQTLYEDLESVREEVRTAAAEASSAAKPPPAAARATAGTPSAPMGAAPIASGLVGGGVVRHTETVRETTRQTIVDQSEADRGTVYGGSPRYAGRARHGTEYGARSGADHAARSDGYGRRGEYDDEPTPAPMVGRRSAERYAAGRDDTDSGYERGVYQATGYQAGGYQRTDERDTGGIELGAAGRASIDRGPEQESWTDRRLRERAAQPREEYRTGEMRRPRPYDRAEPGTDTGEHVRWSSSRPSEIRAGDRWAAVRSDERGRELRVGERRAELHSDGAGTELRVEDRWASVRREEAWSGRRDEGARWDEARDDTHGGGRRARLDDERRDDARHDTGRDDARRDDARRDDARRDEARRDEARRDDARRDDARVVEAWRPRRAAARHGEDQDDRYGQDAGYGAERYAEDRYDGDRYADTRYGEDRGRAYQGGRHTGEQPAVRGETRRERREREERWSAGEPSQRRGDGWSEDTGSEWSRDAHASAAETQPGRGGWSGEYRQVDAGGWAVSGAQPIQARRALPAAPSPGNEPASTWTRGWRDERETESRRADYGDGWDSSGRDSSGRDSIARDSTGRDTGARGSVPARRLDFELSDDRWR